jgi:hypothetical protein
MAKAKVVRHEFMGSPGLFWLLCITVIGIPFAVLYLLSATLTLVEEVDDTEALIQELKQRR